MKYLAIIAFMISSAFGSTLYLTSNPADPANYPIASGSSSVTIWAIGVRNAGTDVLCMHSISIDLMTTGTVQVTRLSLFNGATLVAQSTVTPSQSTNLVGTVMFPGETDSMLVLKADSVSGDGYIQAMIHQGTGTGINMSDGTAFQFPENNVSGMNRQIEGTSPTPEPTTVAMLGLGLGGLLVLRKKMK